MSVSHYITRYEQYKTQLETMLSDGCDLGTADFKLAEVEVDRAFAALIELDLKSDQEVWARTRFFIQEIMKFVEPNSYAEKMAKTIEKDASRLSKHPKSPATPSHTKLLKPRQAIL
jgi:predicted nucleotidyltransferase